MQQSSKSTPSSSKDDSQLIQFLVPTNQPEKNISESKSGNIELKNLFHGEDDGFNLPISNISSSSTSDSIYVLDNLSLTMSNAQTSSETPLLSSSFLESSSTNQSQIESLKRGREGSEGEKVKKKKRKRVEVESESEDIISEQDLIFQMTSDAQESPFSSDSSMFDSSKWSVEEDSKLKEIIKEFGVRNWKHISRLLGTKSNRQCYQRYRSYGLKKGRFSLEEDETLRKLLENRNSSEVIDWKSVADAMEIAGHSKRTPRQVKERWKVLNANKEKWTPEEDAILLNMKSFGRKLDWGEVYQQLKNRTYDQARTRLRILKGLSANRVRTKKEQ